MSDGHVDGGGHFDVGHHDVGGHHHDDVGQHHHHGDDDASSQAFLTGMLVGMHGNSRQARRAAEPYVEPDYAVVWARLWRVIMPALVVLMILGAVYVGWVFNARR